MRKLMLFSFVILSIAYMSCNSAEGGMSTTAKKNLEVNTAIMKAYESGDFSKMGDYIAADAVDHGGEKGDIKGLENIVAEMKRYKEMVKDTKMEVIKEMADEDYVFQWMKESWTQTRESMGMKPGNYSFNMIEVSKFNAENKITEHWSFIDVNDAMKMMPQPMSGDSSSMNKMDTTARH